MVDVVRDYDNYRIEIGESAEETYKRDLYLIVNKETSIIEAETSSLPRAITIAQASEQGLAELAEGNIPGSMSMLLGGEDDGGFIN